MADTDPITRLNEALEGRYRIERELGEGGMATVYLAQDVRHRRNVALKVLKPELAAVVGSERFLAEIETTANLQHPHILPLFDSGEADGFLFYVMPYVEGESLRDRLDREHQLPVDDAVRIASNIAEALDYAHRRGVIHRDIKPANILLQSGKPVISDFGIALAVGAAGGGRLTETGLSLGTPHYMSPEQATGDLNVGPQTDIYALGCVLYEMLVGDPPHMGSTPQAVLGKIITEQPPLATEQRRSVPTHVDAVIAQALQKVPADRFRDAASLNQALRDPGFRYGERAPGSEAGLAAGPSRALLGTLAITTVFSTGVAAWALLKRDDPEPVVRSVVNVEPSEDHGVALSPDGQLLIVAKPHTQPGAPVGLVVRPLNSLTSTPLPGSEGTEVYTPSVSPDGTEVAFHADGEIKVAALSSGTVRTVASSASGMPVWGPDGYIYFTTAEDNIARVPLQGGSSEAVTELAEGDVSHGNLTVLPSGRGVFTVQRLDGSARIEAIDLATSERRVLTAEGGAQNPHVTPTGHLVFGTTDGRLMAAPFDADDVELTGPVVQIVDGLRVYGALDLDFVSFSLSDEGTLAYVAGPDDPISYHEFVWVNRSGQVEPLDPGHRFNGASTAPGWHLSPDDTQVAYKEIGDQGEDIWVKQLPDGPGSRLTFSGEGRTYRPTWTPDGRWVTYFSGAGQDRNVWMKRADGIGEPVLLLDDEVSFAQGAWSPDGEWLILRSRTLGTGDIMAFRPDVDSAAVPLIATEFAEFSPAISPDGRWLAYSSAESGVQEVYMRSFPDVTATRFQISTDGGIKPVWAHSGRELFFVNRDGEMVSAALSAEGRVAGLTTLFDLPDGVATSQNGDFFDVALDDQRFLMARLVTNTSGDAQLQLVLVQNFFEELKRLVPN